MSNILVIAEKPEVAKDISSAMIPAAKEGKGYFYGDVDGDTWVVTSAFGHLLMLCDPEDYDRKYASWKLEDLPVYFPDWELKESPDAYKKERLKLIRKLLAKTDTVIAAGDPDDEGQLLIDEIIDFLQFHGPVNRVLINDSMPDNIRREFSRMRSNDGFRSLGYAAGARRMADYCFGVNETRLAGIRLHQKGLAVGRVQTPTLGLVIARDMLIEQHVKTKYYEMDLQVESEGAVAPFRFKADKKYLKDQQTDKILDRDMLERVGKSLEGTDVEFQTKVKDKVSNPPLPYNLTALQSDMSRRYGYSMSRTLNITQSLRSKHAITYNRSDSQFLKEEHFKEAPELFRTILNGALPGKYQLDFTRHSACFNDKLVTAHHGIIPQKNNIDPSKLTSEERRVYQAIVDRYAMQFMKPLVQKVSTSVIRCPFEGYKHTLEHVAYETIDPGYTAFFGKDSGKKKSADTGAAEDDLAGTEEAGMTGQNGWFFPAGDHQGRAESYDIEEKETKPPARYTDGTLAADMASIAKYVKDPEIREILKKKDEGKKGENGSIGTVATRGVIVENLIRRGFLERSGKNILSTRLGREFFAVLPEEITQADTTARWWLIQEAIKDGTETDVNAIQKSVIDVFMHHKDTAYEGKKIRRYEEKPKAEGVWNGTEVQINTTWGKHTFTPQELEDLFAGKRITFDYNGKPVSGQLAEQKYKGRKFIGFQADEPEKKEGYIYGKFGKEEIHFKGTWSGHTFTETEIQSLLAGETITIQAKKKNGQDWEVSGKLAKQRFKGVYFYGFKPDLKKGSQKDES